jgi:hypothetical protein
VFRNRRAETLIRFRVGFPEPEGETLIRFRVGFPEPEGEIPFLVIPERVLVPPTGVPVGDAGEGTPG